MAAGQPQAPVARRRPGSTKVLIIDDDEVARYLLRLLARQTLRVRGGRGHRRAGWTRLAHEERPQVIFLDLTCRSMTGFEVLAALKADPRTRDIPVIIHTSRPMLPEDERSGWPAAAAILPKDPCRASAPWRACATRWRGPGSAAAAGRRPMAETPPDTILIVDDDDASRYAVSRILQQAGFQVLRGGHGRGRAAPGSRSGRTWSSST